MSIYIKMWWWCKIIAILLRLNQAFTSVPSQSRLVGGTVARVGEFPGIVVLMIQGQKVNSCSGTLIDTSHVVTAGHCVHKVEPKQITVNADELSSIDLSKTRQIRVAILNFVHTKYYEDGISLRNDIAVLRITPPFEKTQTLAPVSRAVKTPDNNETCRVAGWGALDEKGSYSNELQRIHVNIIENRKCKEIYRSYFASGMFCAGASDGIRDTCKGDSGGGLICNNQLAGVVSFGVGCGQPRFPGVYTDVSMYSDFIDFSLEYVGDQDHVPKPSDASVVWLNLSNNIYFVAMTFQLKFWQHFVL